MSDTATNNGTQIAQDLAATRENIELATAQRSAMAQHLIDRGAVGISTASPISSVDRAACALVDSLARGELTTAIVFHINPTGADGYVPSDPQTLAAALNGAHVRVEEIGSANVWRIPIASLDDFSVSMDNTFTKPVTNLLCTVVCGPSGEDIRGRRTAAVVANSSSVSVTLTTYLADEETFEIGRVFPLSEEDASSYLITATTAGGVRTEAFGHFDSAGVWIDETGIQSAVPNLDPETGEVTWTNGADGRNDFERIWPWSAVRREKFVLHGADGAPLELDMAGFRPDAFYGVKVETRLGMEFQKLQTDGSFVTTKKDCRILWVSRPDAPGYELSSCFYRKSYSTLETGELTLALERCDGLFIAAHKASSVSMKFPLGGGGSETLPTLNSGTIGATNLGLSVNDFASRAALLNRLTMTDPAAPDTTLPADTTGRRFACMNLDSYMAFWYLFIIQFGTDAQAVFNGITTDANGTAQSKTGVTDPVIAAGYMTGSVGPALGHSPFVYLGIENFGFGSEGDTLADVSYFSGRDTDEAPLETQIFVQPDRSRYTPNNASREAIAANGYKLLTVADSTNYVDRLCGRSADPALRDLHMPTRDDTSFISAKRCDQRGGGIYRIGQGTGTFVLSNATLFGHRYTSTAGGVRAGVCAFGWCYSGYAPGSSHGGHFGSRVTMQL